MPKPLSTTRRQLLNLGLAASIASPWLAPARARTGELHPTPAQTEGPFYPVQLPADHDGDLLRNGHADYRRGTPVWLDGVVTDTAGTPVRGAQVEIWQCDHQGATTTRAMAATLIPTSRAMAVWPWTARGATASAPSGPWPTAAARPTSTSRSAWAHANS